MIAQDPAETLERRQATADLGATIEHLFEIAQYIMKSSAPALINRR